MSKKKEATPEQKQREKVQSFLEHLGIFLIVNLALLIVNLISSPGTLWFYWVTIFWGIGLAMDAFDTFKPEKALADRLMSRQLEDRAAETRAPTRPTSAGTHGRRESEVEQLMAHASGLIDRMRESARRIPNPEVRREALDACAASDQVLAAIGEHPDELRLARDFVHRFLEPSASVISEYSRLANRNVPSARETLEQIERKDLPFITRRAEGVYDRMHRGTLIDLEVAREMLTLDVADAGLPDSPASARIEAGDDVPESLWDQEPTDARRDVAAGHQEREDNT